MIYLDTHVLVWLYANNLNAFTESGLKHIEDHSLRFAPIIRLELHYLYEIQKITVEPAEIIDGLRRSIGLMECSHLFSDVVAESIHLRWTRDPFDRLIVAQSKIASAKLLTKDRNILHHAENAFW